MFGLAFQNRHMYIFTSLSFSPRYIYIYIHTHMIATHVTLALVYSIYICKQLFFITFFIFIFGFI